MFDVDFMLYSPYYPFKDHDALCFTMKKAGSNLSDHETLREKQLANTEFSSIYSGHTTIN